MLCKIIFNGMIFEQNTTGLNRLTIGINHVTALTVTVVTTVINSNKILTNSTNSNNVS